MEPQVPVEPQVLKELKILKIDRVYTEKQLCCRHEQVRGVTMITALWILFFLAFPALLLWATAKNSLLEKIGGVVLC